MIAPHLDPELYPDEARWIARLKASGASAATVARYIARLRAKDALRVKAAPVTGVSAKWQAYGG
jgi:hypothetical protein